MVEWQRRDGRSVLDVDREQKDPRRRELGGHECGEGTSQRGLADRRLIAISQTLAMLR